MPRILLVDDKLDLAALMRRVLERAGFDCVMVGTGKAARAALADEGPFELMLCDLLMPDASGLQLLREVKANHTGTAFVVITAVDDPRVADEALALGAYGYLIKPVEPSELVIAVKNALIRRDLELRDRELQVESERLIERRTGALITTIGEINESRKGLAITYEEATHALAAAAEFHGSVKSAHTFRVGRFSSVIALAVGAAARDAEVIRQAAAFHDIGNVAISGEILAQDGPLTDEQMAEVRQHAFIGSRLLAGFSTRVLKTASMVARTHHERYDGSGYPDGLAGDAIPSAGRIVAIADVFDSMTSSRPHRPPHSIDDAFEYIENGRGKAFDGTLVDGFLSERAEVLRIWEKYSDEGPPVDITIGPESR